MGFEKRTPLSVFTSDNGRSLVDEGGLLHAMPHLSLGENNVEIFLFGRVLSGGAPIFSLFFGFHQQSPLQLLDIWARAQSGIRRGGSSL